jgi:hypothetical protein
MDKKDLKDSTEQDVIYSLIEAWEALEKASSTMMNYSAQVIRKQK